jgi:outer membrane protein
MLIVVFFTCTLNFALAKGIKIGIVDLQRAMREVEDGRKALEKLKKEFDEKQRLLDEKREEIEKLKEELDRQASIMKEDVRRRKEELIKQKFLDWQGLGMKLQRELDEKQLKVLQKLQQKMDKILRNIGSRENYTLILLKDSVLYHPEYMDLTNQVIRMYNEKYSK